MSRHFKQLMLEYEKVHAVIVRRREETKRLNARYTELKKQVMQHLQQHQHTNPEQKHLVFQGHDGSRYKLRTSVNISKVRIGAVMLKRNLAQYQQRYPNQAQLLQTFYAYLQEQCKKGGRRNTKLSRTKIRTKKKKTAKKKNTQQQQERRHSARRENFFSDEDMTPDMIRMLRRVQSSNRLRDREHSL